MLPASLIADASRVRLVAKSGKPRHSYPAPETRVLASKFHGREQLLSSLIHYIHLDIFAKQFAWGHSFSIIICKNFLLQIKKPFTTFLIDIILLNFNTFFFMSHVTNAPHNLSFQLFIIGGVTHDTGFPWKSERLFRFWRSVQVNRSTCYYSCYVSSI